MHLIKEMGWLLFILLTGYLIDPVHYGFIFGYLIIIRLMFSGRESISLMDKSSIILFSFSIVYAMFYSLNTTEGGLQLIGIYALFPVTFYLLGKQISFRINSGNKLSDLFIIIAILYSSITLISVLSNIYTYGFIRLDRDVPTIWGNTQNATGTAVYLFANMCIPAILLFSFKARKKFYNIVLIVIYILSITCVLRLGSRTQIIISILTLLSSIVFLFTSVSIKKKLLIIIGVFAVVNITITYLQLDFDSDLLSAYAGRMESKEYGAATAGGRTERWVSSIEYMFKQPLGWDVKEFGLSHNLWLDTARAGTVISFILLVLFTIFSLKNTFNLLKNKNESLPFKNQVLVYTLGFMLQFFVEPILEGSFELFTFFCMFQGAINGRNQTLNTKLEQDISI